MAPVTTIVTTRTEGPASGKAQAVPCDLAQPGRPIDISVPDDTRFHPGEYFSKTWRLVNAGSCSWTSDYALVWFSGDNLGINRVQPLNMEVRSGRSVDVTVDMVAPEDPGSYQSNWKMRNREGQLFGIGPGGDAAFWARIVVVPVDTLTPTPSLEAPTATQTPVVFASGSLNLKPGDEVDLDSGQLSQADGDDLAIKQSEDGPALLAPLNGARLAAFGMNAPTLEDCLKSSVTDVAVPLDQYQPGSYLCFRTTRSLPGWLSITAVDLKTSKLSVNFVTWAVP